MTQTANRVLRVLALILIVAGVVIGLTAGWAGGLGPIVVGLALLVLDEATRRRRDGRPARS
jgi:membrane associated rhomboid family serine protease